MEGSPMNEPVERRSRGEQGFSLVDVMVAILLLGFIALGIQATLTTAVRQNKLSLERSVATSLAAARLAQISSMPYQDPTSYASYRLPEETAAGTGPYTLTTAVGAIPGQPQYSRTVTLTYNTPVAAMLKVQVDVSWTNRGQNAVKTHRVITFLYPDLTTGG